MNQYLHCRICKKKVIQSGWAQHIIGKKHIGFTPKKILVKAPFGSEKINEIDKYFESFGQIQNKQILFDSQEGKTVIEYSFDVAGSTAIVHKDHELFEKKLEIYWTRSTPVVDVQKPVKPLNENQGNNLIILTPASPSTTTVKQPQDKSAGSNTKLNSSASNSQAAMQPASAALPQDQQMQVKSRQKGADNSEASIKKLINDLKLGETFEDQIGILYNRLKQNQAELENSRKIIRNDLHLALTPMFALARIHLFGSSITGLDIQGSDLDVYIANVRHQTKPELSTLRLIRTFIFKCKKFCDVLLISGAKIPIIKCIHTKTQICCDLNIRNKLSVTNSELIKYYLSLDEKLSKLMILIKFWAERKGIKKVNFFSSYSLYMMVIFFLQQEPYNVPSVMDLQKNVPADIVDGWNCAFTTEQRKIPALQNASLRELAAGFFQFYGDFDYMTYVICPYLGKALRKTGFLKPPDIPDCFQLYLKQNQVFHVNDSFCVQDPFEHARNVSANVPTLCASKFSVMCQHMTNLMSAEPDRNLLFKMIVATSSTKDYQFVMNKQIAQPNEQWISAIKDTTLRVLKEVFGYDVTMRTDPAKGIITYFCVGIRNVWENRVNIVKKFLSDFPLPGRDIERETAVTANISNFFPKALGMKLGVKLVFHEQPSRADFQLLLQTKCKLFLHIANFFRNIMLKTFAPVVVDMPPSTTPSSDGDVEVKPEPTEVEPVVEMIKDVVKTPGEASVCSDNSPVETQTAAGNPETSDCSNQVVSEGTNGPTSNDIVLEETSENTSSQDVVEQTSDKTSNFGDDNSKTATAVVEEEEDVPPDFFDDFANEDFMDGLDIVDAWDNEPKIPIITAEEPVTQKSHTPPLPQTVSTPKDNKPRKEKSRSRSPVRRRKSPIVFNLKRSKSKSRDQGRGELRRDPEKTKRDINRDKLRCAKDKEQKLVTDRLKIVETGLVPPGTEMDVDLSAIISEKRRSVEKRRSLEKRRSIEKRRSLEKRRLERSYSKRSSSREMRKLRYSRSPETFRSRNREREKAPRRRTSSQELRNDFRSRPRKRSRSRSRESTQRQKRKHEEKKKKSFLEEIRDKLNEVRTPQVIPSPQMYANMYNQNPVPMVPPSPVPAPSTNQFYPSMVPQYDQSFFIGDSFHNLNPPQPVAFNMVASAGNVMNAPQNQIGLVPQPHAALKTIEPQLVTPDPSTFKKAEENNTESTEDIDKLFADKKISLSDFLTITAKCEVNSSTPEHLQKKIKVISRCQDAIKELSENRKFTGRLSVKTSLDSKSKGEAKYQSPLRRIPVIRFQFTSPAKINEEADAFVAALEKVLRRIGIKETIDLDEPIQSSPINIGFMEEETASLTLKASLLSSKLLGAVSCEECKKRKLKTFADAGAQCSSTETVSIGVQTITEESSPLKVFSRNESIAYLTPAQLLGKDKDKQKEIDSNVQPLLDSPDRNKNDTKQPVMEKTNSPVRGRMNARRNLGARSFNFNNEVFFDRNRCAENFGPNYGGPPQYAPPRMNRMQQHQQQFREDDQNNFTQSYRGRKPNKFGPRF